MVLPFSAVFIACSAKPYFRPALPVPTLAALFE
jgi:hypothetical protein